MRILFINPPAKKIFMKEIGRCGSTASADQLWPQTGLAYLAAVAEKEGHTAAVIDGMVERNTAGILKNISKFNPGMAIVLTSTPTYKNDLEFASKLSCRIGFVGTHASIYPVRLLEESNADFVLVNEPEITLANLLKGKELSKIKGLCYKKDGKIKLNPKNPPRKDIDTIPFPARHLLKNNDYRMVLTWNKPFTTIVTSRGCPYSCIFCRKGITWGGKFVTRTPENVMKELEQVIAEQGITNFIFMTDTFTLVKSWVMKFCRLIHEKNLSIKWWCNSRVDTIDEEMIIAMKAAGCQMISFGIESGVQKVLDRSKKKITVEQARKAVKLAKKHKIKVFAYFVLGLPGDDMNSIRQTVKFAKELDPDYVNFHISTPFPGTELHEIASKNSWITDNDWSHYDQSGNYVVSGNGLLSPEQLIKARGMAMRKFYFRPKILIRELIRAGSISSLTKKLRVGLKILSNNYK